MRARCSTRSATPKRRPQLQRVTAEKPDYAEAWLVQGTLEMQDNQLPAAEASLKRYLELRARPSAPARNAAAAWPGLPVAGADCRTAQGFRRRPSAWLDRIENAQDLISAQTRRAALLARQGKLDEARKLIRSLPERNAGRRPHEDEGRSAAAARQQAVPARLRSAGQGQRLHATRKTRTCSTTRPCWPRSWATLDEMERLLRQLIAAQAGLPPRLQRAGLFAGRSQRAPARGPAADPEGARLRRATHSSPTAWAGSSSAAATQAEALRILRGLQAPAGRRDRRPPGRGAVEHGPARPGHGHLAGGHARSMPRTRPCRKPSSACA